MMSKQWGYTTAREWIGDSVLVHPEGEEALSLRLVKVIDKGAPGPYEQFSLLFSGAVESFLRQGLYRVEHPSVGSALWMLVPVGQDEDGYVYEAVFSISKTAESSKREEKRV